MMNSAVPPSIFDTQSLTKLKSGLRQDDPKALKAAAQQFEAVFLQMMLKTMRSTVPQEGMFDSDQTRFYQELLDSQLAQSMAAKGGTGLAALIERQLARPTSTEVPYPVGGIPLPLPAPPLPLNREPRSMPLPAEGVTVPMPLQGSPVRPASERATMGGGNGGSQADAFVASVWPHAQTAGSATGVPPQFLVAHAALESGWGRAEPRFANGSSSYNLFGIKAGSQWQGATVDATTTEYVDGTAVKRVEHFRAYGSYAEAFQDYARLLAQTPRYAEAVASRDAAGFARGLQRGGYATDPDYSVKLERLIGGLSARMSKTLTV